MVVVLLFVMVLAVIMVAVVLVDLMAFVTLTALVAWIMRQTVRVEEEKLAVVVEVVFMVVGRVMMLMTLMFVLEAAQAGE